MDYCYWFLGEKCIKWQKFCKKKCHKILYHHFFRSEKKSWSRILCFPFNLLLEIIHALGKAPNCRHHQTKTVPRDERRRWYGSEWSLFSLSTDRLGEPFIIYKFNSAQKSAEREAAFRAWPQRRVSSGGRPGAHSEHGDSDARRIVEGEKEVRKQSDAGAQEIQHANGSFKRLAGDEGMLCMTMTWPEIRKKNLAIWIPSHLMKFFKNFAIFFLLKNAKWNDSVDILDRD